MIAKFSVAVRGYTDEDADMLCLDLYVDFVSLLSLKTHRWPSTLTGRRAFETIKLTVQMKRGLVAK